MGWSREGPLDRHRSATPGWHSRLYCEDSLLYARRVVDRITARTKQIADFPRAGRQVPEYEDENVREVIEGRYRIIYRILSDRVDVVAVIHAARELPRRL
jgi:plasmid stabilization system protein ParE